MKNENGRGLRKKNRTTYPTTQENETNTESLKMKIRRTKKYEYVYFEDHRGRPARIRYDLEALEELKKIGENQAQLNYGRQKQ